MISDLGQDAPPYIVIVLSFGMISTVAAAIKQYQDYSINIYQARIFLGCLPLAVFVYFFAFTSTVLLVASIANIFSDHCLFKYYTQAVIKICLAICAACFVYFLKEYITVYKEELEDKT